MQIYPLNRLGLQEVPDFSVLTPREDKRLNLPIGTIRSYNPKTYDVVRAIPGYYDRPSTTSSVSWASTTDPKYNFFQARQHPLQFGPDGELNPTYHLNDSNIVYYIDPTIQAAFYKPVFLTPCTATYEDYVDPMGSWKPHYKLNQPCSTQFNAGLSFINDTLWTRQDIMSLQQSVHNQEKSDPFFK